MTRAAEPLTGEQWKVLRQMVNSEADFRFIGAWDLKILIDAGFAETYQRGRKNKWTSWRATPAGRDALKGEK